MSGSRWKGAAAGEKGEERGGRSGGAHGGPASGAGALDPWGGGQGGEKQLNSGFIFNDEPTSVFVERLAVEWGSQMGVQESSMLPGGCFS